MSRIAVVFSRAHNLGSLGLRTAMWSPWSHCGLVMDDVIVEATARYGVRRIGLQSMMEYASRTEIIFLPCVDPVVAYAAAESQIGKPYDWGMVVGHPFRQDWEDTNKWSCSELVAWAIQEGGTELFRTKAGRITPYHLYLPRFV